MRAHPIKTWSLMTQSLRNKFGVENHERQRQGQAKEKFMKSSMDEMSTKVNELHKFKTVQKFEAQNMEHEGILDFIINKSNSSFSFFCDRMQFQFLNFLTTTRGTKPNHGMKAKEEAWERSLALDLKTHH
ncbi:hypothetical protein M9H77_02298 [Catharanthus roseus]|uniref:Uncharacterized protein n=1 Tax=Catharanthus roseus TaxID=4058 RepID=A0ACC0C8I1_CATRO|nr:hypothetical protein M9H77_02298 [Catharanthus roseus]